MAAPGPTLFKSCQPREAAKSLDIRPLIGTTFRPRSTGNAEPRPGLHQLTTLLEQVAAAVCGLDLALDRVREGHLDYLTRKIRALGRPVPEGRTEPVCGEVIPSHPLEHRQHRHVRKGLALFAASEH